MKMIVVVALALVALAAAAPVDEPIAILRNAYEPSPEGGYNYGYETANGINHNEQGSLKEAVDEDNKPRAVVVVRGSYNYPDPDGNPISVTYEADENGFRAFGDHIPKPARR